MTTGTFTRIVRTPSSLAYPATYLCRRDWYRQKRPYNLALPFTMTQCRVFNHPWYDLDADYYQGLSNNNDDNDPYWVLAQAEAYESLRSSITDTASLAANLAEKKQSVDMIAKRFSQLASFAMALKRFDFLGAAKVLGLRVNKEKSRWVRIGKDRVYRLRVGKRDLNLIPHIKSFGNNFLEYHFGWEPLIKDVYTSVEIVHEPVFKGALKRVKGRKTIIGPGIKAPFWQSPNTIVPVDRYESRVMLSAEISVTNTNLFNLQRLGLLNPASVAWEVVPFSFLADWVANVGNVLRSYTDWVGLSVRNAFSSHLAKCERQIWHYDVGPNGSSRYVTARAETVTFRRTIGIATPSLTFKEVKLPSVTRGLTAASLLSTLLGRW